MRPYHPPHQTEKYEDEPRNNEIRLCIRGDAQHFPSTSSDAVDWCRRPVLHVALVDGTKCGCSMSISARPRPSLVRHWLVQAQRGLPNEGSAGYRGTAE